MTTDIHANDCAAYMTAQIAESERYARRAEQTRRAKQRQAQRDRAGRYADTTRTAVGLRWAP